MRKKKISVGVINVVSWGTYKHFAWPESFAAFAECGPTVTRPAGTNNEMKGWSCSHPADK